MSIGTSVRGYIFIILTLGAVLYSSLLFPFPYIHEPVNDMALLLFFVLSILLNAYPIKSKDVHVSLILLIHLFIFIQFGFLVELMISQLGLVIYHLFSQEKPSMKHLLNHCLYFWLSFGSALAYHTVQTIFPHTYAGENIPIFSIFAYVGTGIFIHYLFIRWLLWVKDAQKHTITWLELRWVMLTQVLSIPVSILIYVAYHSGLGLTGAIIVSIPTMIIAYIFKLLNDVEQANKQLSVIHELTSSFTTELNINRNLEALVQAIHQIHPYDMCAIFRLDARSKTLIPMQIDIRDNTNRPNMSEDTLDSEVGIAGQVIATGKPLMLNHEYHLYLATGLPRNIQGIQSILAVPMKMNEQVVGMIFLGRRRENGFTKKDRTLLEIISNHAATSMRNAYIFQQTERRALHDELTGLYNYRGFELKLNEEIYKAKQANHSIGLLIIDIDHFKNINDQFGHVVGNKVLEHLAQLFKSHVRKHDIVARYGGEEFTIILPDTDLQAVLEIGERLREAVPSHPLKVRDELDADKDKHIQTTVSIGISLFPDHADDALNLVRHADRAMYVGAKQAGRNKVAVYDAS